MNTLNLEKLLWDTDFFGLQIAKLSVDESHNEDEIVNLLEADTSNLDLVYIFSTKLLPTFEKKLFSDKKLVFCKQPEEVSLDVPIEIFQSDKHSFDELYNLVLISGSNSRFKRDPRFGRKRFEELYKRWIERSIEHNQSKVFIWFDQSMKGFVTVDQLSSTDFQIGLIAVNPKDQKQGIAAKLIKFIENYIRTDKGNRLLVATQEVNEDAVRFYQKNQFSLLRETFIYHYWIGDSI